MSLRVWKTVACSGKRRFVKGTGYLTASWKLSPSFHWDAKKNSEGLHVDGIGTGPEEQLGLTRLTPYAEYYTRIEVGLIFRFSQACRDQARDSFDVQLNQSYYQKLGPHRPHPIKPPHTVLGLVTSLRVWPIFRMPGELKAELQMWQTLQQTFGRRTAAWNEPLSSYVSFLSDRCSRN